MSREGDVERLLHWRLAWAEAAAPPPPCAGRLARLARLARTETCAGHPVPAHVINAAEDVRTWAYVLQLGVRDGRLQLRFTLDAGVVHADPTLDVTVVSDEEPAPLFSAPATASLAGEYCVDAELPPHLRRRWGQVTAMQRIPFRLILHSPAAAR